MRTGFSRFVSSGSAWVFGLACSVLLISVWGRAVVVDTDSLADNLRPLSQSQQVSRMFADWMNDQLVEVGIPEESAAVASESALLTPDVQAALGELVEQVVVAAATPGVERSEVDVARALAPSVPALTGAVRAAGVAVSEPQVEAVVAGLDPLVIRQEGEPPVVGESSPIAGRLGLASLLAALTMLVSGATFVLVSASRRRAIRSLLTRLGLGALSFAVLLKLGGWVLDPRGGRAPVSQAASMVADSKWVIPAIIGAVASIGSLLFWAAKAPKPAVELPARPAPATTPPG